ncbi:CaiB/baiF CoA-transferase [Pseudomonas agarici]|uniref:CaiB/baiF CoA-transferase n=1 Tax=Pseudomonas agarici TaxID=46677 RepID=A0A0X1T7U2_PSEAA|nr:CoA transferase [Pseudomonas agarici]AMB88154.1 CaiB/baiF CoA-transferase [Pseudomonas agarici]NWB93581.1 CoA transferase [Pseudomonas agarici]NWC11116.1 CoA transferase [Pseudomonas agarici]SEL58318.1 Crotonobetainyl-CoA:carnitine CoA-transferase CaiB [Pseudomonas agarici]
MQLPLSGVKVLDLTRALSGPFCSMILADLGAEVIKVEPTPHGDMIRQWGPFDGDISVYYLSANRNKKDIGVDFRQAEGLALIKELALKSDVVVENFKVGTMAAMGLSYETLCAHRPELIYASISGFGSTGPARNWPGFDQIAQGYSGFMSLTGTPESGPTRVGTAIGDLTAGMWVAMGVLAAYIERQRSGRGQQVETSLLASLIGLLSVQGQRYLSVGEIPGPSGNVHPVIAPYGTFETADGPLNLAPAAQDMWIRLCHILELPQLTQDSRFKTNAERMHNSLALKALLEGSLRKKTRMEWTSAMIEAGIPAGPINTLEDVFNDEQVIACGLVETVEHPLLGALKQVALPIKMASLAQGSVRTAPPLFGQHTKQVLADYGLSPETIAQLLEKKVVHQCNRSF